MAKSYGILNVFSFLHSIPILNQDRGPVIESWQYGYDSQAPNLGWVNLRLW